MSLNTIVFGYTDAAKHNPNHTLCISSMKWSDEFYRFFNKMNNMNSWKEKNMKPNSKQHYVHFLID